MHTVSLTPVERARKMVQTVLQRLQEPGTGVAISSAMGISESTLSRLKNEHLEPLAQLLAHAGFKIVGAERVCVDPQTYEALTHIASKAMADVQMTRQLLWEGD